MVTEENSAFLEMGLVLLDSGKKAKLTESLKSTTQMDMPKNKVYLVGTIVLRILK